MWKSLLAATLVIFVSVVLSAAERKQPDQVDTNKLLKEIATASIDKENISVVEWMPREFWEVVLAKDPTTDQHSIDQVMQTLGSNAIVAIVQADVGMFGTYTYYPRYKVEGNTRMYYVDALSMRHDLVPIDPPNADFAMMLEVFKPIFKSALGSLGENLHLFVVADTAEDGHRIMDPYVEGQMVFELGVTGGGQISLEISAPLDALYIPRKCPNGRDAHVSWKYCPWTGEKLPD